MSNTKTYTFTEEQLRVVIEDAVDLRDHEVAMNPFLGKPVRTPTDFADEYTKTLGDTFNKKGEVKEAEPKDEHSLPGYISSRPVDKLQFNIDTLKLGNLPGAYEGIQEEGGFFKAFATAWNNEDWEEDEAVFGMDDTVSNTLDRLHCYGNFWVNPKYANSKVSALGEIGCRSVAIEGKTDICIAVYYLKKDGTVIAYDIDAD